MTASLAQRLGGLDAATRAAILDMLAPLDVRRLAYAWQFWSRPEQRAPAGEWSVWLVEAGRGFGKTRAGAEWVRERIEAGEREIALIGPTLQDVRDTMLGEGTDAPGEGLLNVFPPDQRPIWLEQKRRVVIPAFPACRVKVHTAEEPEFRGPNTGTIWGDELCKWPYADKLWPNIEMTLRRVARTPPRVCITTTPKKMAVLTEIRADAGTVVTKGSTFDNAANLDSSFIRKMVRKYAGTRIGLQELFAIEQGNDGAMFDQEMIDAHRVRPGDEPKFRRAVVCVDPATSTNRGSDDTGILAAAEGVDGHVYVLEDASGRYKPDAWAIKVFELFVDHGAELVVVERNAGGDLVRANLVAMARVIETAPEHAALRARLGPRLRQIVAPGTIREIHAKQGKTTRAEPVVSAYQQGRVHHVGRFQRLEKQQVEFDPNLSSMANKDAFDVAVYAVWELLRLERDDVEPHMSSEGLPGPGPRLDVLAEAGGRLVRSEAPGAVALGEGWSDEISGRFL